MTGAVAPAPREQGWKPVILALAAFLLLPMLPHLRAVVPVEQTSLLLVPALAVCTLVGWWSGGRLTLALVWTALAAWVLVQAPPDGSGAYGDLARGWGLLTAAAFGVVCVAGSGRPFLHRALSAVGLVVAFALVLAAAKIVDPGNAARALAEQFASRNAQSMQSWNAMSEQYPGEWRRLIEIVPTAGSYSMYSEDVLRSLSALALPVFPALLALESLAALALAWALYHRLSRTRIGAPLAPLREFRFNDQLVWGLIVGFAVVFLPSLASLRGAGLNLLVFFGALFALRGLGIISFFFSPGGVATAIAVTFAMIVAMIIWPILAPLAALALGLGLGDTWLDWRRRVRPST